MKTYVKYCLFLFLLLSDTAIINAKNHKKEFDELKQYHKLQLADSLYDYRFTVIAVPDEKPELEKTYTWYMKNSILVTQGNYSGKLLHGAYTKYYCKTSQLAEKGDYGYGLKEGVWSEWNSNGTFSSNITYRKGVKKGKAMFYDSSGNIVEKCRFKNDKRNGKSYTYIDGVEQKPVKYKNGIIKQKKPLFGWLKKKNKKPETGLQKETAKEKQPKEVKEKEAKEKSTLLKNAFKKKTKEEKAVQEKK
ncbi:MAG: hypothetical protein LBR52_03770 [Prevotellaceae bacterium]|jgi:antitoxin component YwqK of YwqJK toxin-antitoxin module|nr:hypothetical protein [Prevotellaceae bacterium]